MAKGLLFQGVAEVTGGDPDAAGTLRRAATLAEGVATLPDGSTKRLLSITNWDFNWQGVYRYATPVSLPAGTTVTMRWTYDNSPDNPFNQNRPPKRVTYGQRTSDEMSELWFQVVPLSQKDRATFTRDLRARETGPSQSRILVHFSDTLSGDWSCTSNGDPQFGPTKYQATPQNASASGTRMTSPFFRSARISWAAA